MRPEPAHRPDHPEPGFDITASRGAPLKRRANIVVLCFKTVGPHLLVWTRCFPVCPLRQTQKPLQVASAYRGLACRFAQLLPGVLTHRFEEAVACLAVLVL